MGMKPQPVFLKPGDVVTLGIKGLGEQRQKVVRLRRLRCSSCASTATVCGSR